MSENLEGVKGKSVGTGGVWGALARMWSGDDEREREREAPAESPGTSWFGEEAPGVIRENLERMKPKHEGPGELRGQAQQRAQDAAQTKAKDDAEEARRARKQREEEEQKKKWEEAQREAKRKALLTDPMHGMTREQYELFQKKATEGKKPEEAEKAMDEALTTEFLSSGNRNVPSELVGAYLPAFKQAHAEKEWGYKGAPLDNKRFLERARSEYDLNDQLMATAGVAGIRGMRPARAFANWERKMEATHPAWPPLRRHELEAKFTGTMNAARSLMREYGPGIQRWLPGFDISTVFGTPPEYAVLADGSIGEKGDGKSKVPPVGRVEYDGITVTDGKALLEVMPLAGKQKVYLTNPGLTAAQADDKEVVQWEASMQSMVGNFSYSSAYGGYNMRFDPELAAKAARNPKGDSADRYMMDLKVARERHERYIEGRASGYKAAFESVVSEGLARHEELLERRSRNEATDEDLRQHEDAYRKKVAEMRVKGTELAQEARKYFLDGTLSAQGYLALGQATGMGNLLEAHVDGEESQARVDAAVKDGKPIVSGTQNLWGHSLGAHPAVDPLKRREDQKLIAEARNTKRSIKVTLRNGKVLRHELPSVTVKKLEAMRSESEAYLDRNFYDPDKYNIDGAGKRYLRPELLQNLPGQEVPKDFPFPGSVLTEEQMARISDPKATPSTNEEIPYLLRMMGLTNQMSDIKRIEVETPEKALTPILERMRVEAAPIEAELDKYLDKFDLNPEERAVARYRIIADATRSIPVGLWEMVSSGERMSEKLPYAGGFIAIANMWNIGSIANRVAKGEKVSDADMAVLEYALLDMERDESRAAAIVSGALDILSLGVEVGTSGGIVSLGRKAGTETAELAMREGLERLGTAEARKALRGMMARRVLTTGMEVAVQTAGPSAHRWVKEAYVNAFIKGVHPYQGPDGEYYAQLDAGHQRGSFWDAAPKAIAHGLVDNISERTGGLLLKWPGAQEAFAKMGTKAREELAKRAMLQLAIEKVGADKAVRFLSRGNEKLGMHGMHREYLEEVDAAFGHALVDGEAPRFMGTDDVINMMASMALARGVMGGGSGRGEQTNASNEPPFPRQPMPQAPEGGFAVGGNRSAADADIWKPTIGGGIYPAGEEGAGNPASTGVQNSLGGAAAGGEGTGAQPGRAAASSSDVQQSGMGTTPQQSDALVPSTIGAPNADEASDHAVPPGGSGMGLGGGSTGGATPSDAAAGGMEEAGDLPPLTPEQRTSKQGAGKPQPFSVEEEQSEPVRKLSSRPWAENEGRIRAAVPAERLRAHPDYTAAMAGDAAAAQRMVGSLASGNHLREVAARHPRARIVAAPDSRQPGRANPVAQAFAQHLQAGTSLQISSEISLRVAPVSADAPLLTRMAFQPQYQGKVEPGAEYIVVADQVGTGVSAASLRHYIERNGGRVVFIDSLGTSGSQDIAITPATRDAVIAKYRAINGISATLRANGFYGGQVGSLSEAEGRELLKFGTEDDLENALEKEAKAILATRGITSPSFKQLQEVRGLIGWDDITLEEDHRLYELRSNLKSPTSAERRRLGKKYEGNIAYLDGTIEGRRLEGYERLSGTGTKGMPLATPSRYETVPTTISRSHDSEVYLFGNLAANLFKQFGSQARNAKGKIVLVSERGICPSCQGVVQMFREDFPDITVEIRTGKD